MALRLPTPPPWIDALPRDARGFPVPAESGWENGKPLLAVTDVKRKVALGMRRACSVCGYRMPAGRHVYRAFGHADAADIRATEREVAVGRAGPAHRSCMVYSAMVCPFLRGPNAKLGAGKFEIRAARGADAAVMGFEDFGLLIYGRRHPLLAASHPVPQFTYLNLADDFAYQDGGTLQGSLDDAVESDAALIECSAPRLFWTDGPADAADLTALSDIDIRTIARSDPAFMVQIQDDPYIAIRC